MKEDKKLTVGMFLFTALLFISFGIIIMTEKLAPYFAPKIDKKLNSYIKEKYDDDFKYGKTTYKNTKYQLKVSSSKNNNLYFVVTYNKKQITDTYKKDYYQGKTLLTELENNLEKKLEKQTKRSYHIKTIGTLDQYSKQIREEIIKKNKIENLKIYTLETTLTTTWTTENIVETISQLHKELQSKNITPRSYNLIITNKEDLTESIKINNLIDNLLEKETLTNIITDIKNKNEDSLKQYNITYEWLGIKTN